MARNNSQIAIWVFVLLGLFLFCVQAPAQDKTNRPRVLLIISHENRPQHHHTVGKFVSSVFDLFRKEGWKVYIPEEYLRQEISHYESRAALEEAAIPEWKAKGDIVWVDNLTHASRSIAI